jgi:hypothetical protein
VNLVDQEGMLAATKVDSAVISVNNGSSSEILEVEKMMSYEGFHTADVKDTGQTMPVATQCKFEDNDAYSQMKEAAKTVPKPRLALFQGKEDDEPMAPQVIGNNIKEPSFIKLGAFSFDSWKNMTKDWIALGFLSCFSSSFLSRFICPGPYNLRAGSTHQTLL